MKRIRRNGPLLIVCLTAIRCTQTYLPPPIANPAANLVVEGFINNGSDSTIINLSRTFPLTTSAIRLPEPDGKQYASDYVPPVNNPPIYANTHDPSGNARYFRWGYEESWEFHSAFFAILQYVNNSLQNYSPNTIDSCWKYDPSTSILLSSTIHNSPDVVYEMPLVLIPLNSEQISVKYSILVKQYGLDLRAFTWWQTLQNNTGNIGSIFGVMPTTNPGNIHCLTDSTAPVVGYVSTLFGSNVRPSFWQ